MGVSSVVVVGGGGVPVVYHMAVVHRWINSQNRRDCGYVTVGVVLEVGTGTVAVLGMDVGILDSWYRRQLADATLGCRAATMAAAAAAADALPPANR